MRSILHFSLFFSLVFVGETAFAVDWKCKKANCVSGYGEAEASGFRYEGEWLNGQPSGAGKLLRFTTDSFTDRWTLVYEGQFLAGNRHGNGVYLYASGDRYEGDFLEGKQNGFGTYYRKSGERYEGEWVDGKYHGKGVFYLADGRKLYEGDYSNDKRTGRGELYEADGGRYKGDFVDGRKNGEGTQYFTNGDRYEGDWSEDIMAGRGTYYFSNGNRYVGEIADGNMNGIGTFYLPDGGRYYEGNWVDGQRSGKGRTLVDGKVTYDGDWKANQPNGIGTYYYPDGASYSGQIENNLRQGSGTFKLASGAIYKGEFVKDRRHGKGTMIFENGDRYEGGWLEDHLTGQGTLYLADGSRYDGGWERGLQNGEGTEYDADGRITKQGLWKDGELIRVTPLSGSTQSSGRTDAETVTAQCIEGDCRNGYGVQTFSNGLRYEGTWKNGQRTKGTMFHGDGGKYVGEFKNFLRHGRGTSYNADGSVYADGIWETGKLVKSLSANVELPKQDTAIAVDTQPPEITLQRGLGVVVKARHTLMGTASDASGVAIVEVNGAEAALDEYGNFSAEILLAPGQNTVTIAATDTRSNSATKSFTITRESARPSLAAAATGNLSSINTGEYHALLIGVDKYESSQITDLSEPIKNTSALRDVLVKNYAFESANVRQLSNPTRDEILDELDRLSERLNAEDNLLIFYAGHGFWDEGREEGYWLPHDADQKRRRDWISNATVVSAINGIKTQHTLLISDACFSGGIFKTRSTLSDAPEATQSLYKLPSRKAMTSGTLTEVPDKSVFIEYLIKRLENNDNKYATSQEIFASMRTAVINNSPTKQVPQFGEIRETGDEGGDFIFVRR